MFSSKDQKDAPLCEALVEYKQQNVLPFTVPGHKRGQGIDDYTREILGEETFANDIPLLGGLDDRRETKQVRQKAEQIAAELYAADKCFFSVNGSSMSAHVALMTVANPGDAVIFPRNSHKSVVAAAIFAGIKPILVEPALDAELDIQHGFELQQVEKILRDHPDAKAMLITNPSYYGISMDVKAVADACHKQGIPLIVDEAWGPQFPFHPDFPPSAVQAGADLVYTSVHKNLASLGQSSIILQKGKLIDVDRLQLSIHTFETTSPSSLLLCSIDATRRQMALEGKQLWEKALELARAARRELSAISGVRVLGSELIGRPGVQQLDELKIVIDVLELKTTGFAVADRLFDKHKIMLEMADERKVMGLVTRADTKETVNALVTGLKYAIAEAAEKNQIDKPLPSLKELETEEVMAARDAFLAPCKTVPLSKAVDQVCAEIISPYPPGIPRIMPGERITESLVDYLQRGVKVGMYVDSLDPEMKTIRVVDFDKSKP